MKRTALIRSIRQQAKDAGLTMDLVREGREHEIWRVGGTDLPIPRHREISPGVTRKLLKAVEEEVKGR
jgi:hypothetical protein